jgi:thioredoxin 1
MDLNDDNFEEEVTNSASPVLVDFWASWCSPCKLVAPIVEEIAQEYEGRLKVCKFDVEQKSNTPSKYGIMSIPALFIFKGGEVKEQIVGYVPKQHIVEKIERVL